MTCQLPRPRYPIVSLTRRKTRFGYLTIRDTWELQNQAQKGQCCLPSHVPTPDGPNPRLNNSKIGSWEGDETLLAPTLHVICYSPLVWSMPWCKSSTISTELLDDGRCVVDTFCVKLSMSQSESHAWQCPFIYRPVPDKVIFFHFLPMSTCSLFEACKNNCFIAPLCCVKMFPWHLA